MGLPSRIPTLSFGSGSSSVYSEDALVSEVNSNGTQVHHKSHLRPNIGGVPRENGQTSERPSDLSLTQDNITLNQDGSAVDLHSVNTPITQYRFETATEAALRHLEARKNAPAKGDKNEREKHLQMWKSGLRGAYDQDGVQAVNQTRLDPDSWNYDDEWFLQHHSELDSSDLSVPRAYVTTQWTATPDSLSGRTTRSVNGEESMKTGDDLVKTYLEVSGSNESQGSIELHDNQPDSQPIEANLLSKSGRKYGLGDHGRGYIAGHYVTELESHKESPPERRKKREVVKNFFCMRR